MDVEVVVLEEENEVECIDNKPKEKDDHVHVKENGKGDLHIVKHNKDEGDIGPKECSGSGVDVKVEEKVNNDEDLASDSFEMLVDDSDNEQSSASDYDEKAKNEVIYDTFWHLYLNYFIVYLHFVLNKVESWDFICDWFMQ